MRVVFKRRTLITIVLLIALGILLSYSSGYRFSPYEAAMAHFDVDKSATEFGDVNFQLSRVYLFNTPNGPRTVIAIKEGLLWRAHAASRFPKSSDRLRQLGG
ncbi:hypothetical protein [Desulfitobacterium metallireducens]|uniref:Uncharacterized protein n=1 Tax=Desulfitobacterium metallireducens DSM 15288 TaxID=871968 RepID=W0EC18_9FIRM|nr:hypothetical protein [Desulfitobacterium metallireducens]AHF08415.1 hypothetical protein DESME_02210 [Desulfitobacterium metallireducens DSM 15288]